MSRPHSPFKLSSRPNSRSSPARPLATPLTSHGRSLSRSKWMGFVPGASGGAGSVSIAGPSNSLGPASASTAMASHGRRGSTASSNGAAALPPSPHHQRASSTSATPTSILYDASTSAALDGAHPLARGDYVTRAEQYDVVLERSEEEEDQGVEEFAAQAILPYLGLGIVDQTGRIEGIELDPRSSSVPWQSSSTGAEDTSLPRSGSGGSITAVRGRPYTEQDEGGTYGKPPKQRDERSQREKEEKFRSALLELLSTERSYVKRIEALYHRYANPLRQMARDKDTAIIPLYEAQRLFGNIGEILGANSAFLKDLERVVEGEESVEGERLGEVIYRHLACFHCYNEYLANIEKAKHVEQTMTKANRSFREFVDRTKYSTQGLGNIGLRELLMEPVQRIPRYTLLLELLLRNLPASKEAMRKRLVEANSLAAKIASREVDEQTRRAAVLWSLSRCVDGFPAGLISVHRQFIDCVDVEDFPMDVFGASLFSPSSSISGSTSGVHHCTLFLFDDRLVVCKRASSSSSGRRIVGLDDLNRLADLMKTCTERSGKVDGSGNSKELGFRGMIDIHDVRARDLGAADFQLYFSTSLSHVTSDKWANRPVRQYATHDSYASTGATGGVSSSSTSYAFPSSSESAYQGASGPSEKVRFLENLWRAQALGKTKERRSAVRCSIFPPVAAQGEGARVRRIVFWNVYSRRGYLLEPRKAPVVLHVDPLRQADDVPLGHETAPPHASLRLHSVDEDYGECSYSIYVKGTHGSSEQHLLPLAELPSRLRLLATDMSSQYEDDFAPNRSRASPSTPASHRGRVVQGLENFGRNLFGGGGASTPGSFRSAAGSDLFGSPRRNKSSASKGSSAVAMTLSRKGSSSAHTYSTIQTSVGSREMLGSKLSPESAWHAAYLAQGPSQQHSQQPDRRRSQSRSRAATPELFERHRRAISEGPDGGYEGGSSPARSAVGDVTARYDDSADVDVTLAPGLSPGGASLRHRTRSTPSRPDWASTSHSRPPSSGGRVTPLGPSRGATSNRQASASPIRRKPPPKANHATDDDEAERSRGAEDVEVAEAGMDFEPSPPVRRGYGSASKRRLPSDAQQGASASAKRHTSFGSERRRQNPSVVEEPRADVTRQDGQSGEEDPWTALARDLELINARGSERVERRLATQRIEENLARIRSLLDSSAGGSGGGVSVAEASSGDSSTSTRAEAQQDALPSSSEREASLRSRLEEVEEELKVLRPLKGQLKTMERKCELLTTLEEDGRRENEILHKAFNEELDALYEQTALVPGDGAGELRGECQAVMQLRDEVKRTKAQRNEVWQRNKTLQRELALERAQREVYEKLLSDQGLL